MRFRLVLLLSLAMFCVSAQVQQSQAQQSQAQQKLAQQKAVVVELFTSQGCSSCPPADMLLDELSHRDDVLALSLHVDYWDYIGWRDVFGSPANTERQRQYAHVSGRDMLYTPQMIINGTVDVVGNRVEDVTTVIRAQLSKPSLVQMNAQRSGTTLQIKAQTMGQAIGPIRVLLVRYQPSAMVDVEGGENAGHKLHYTNVVHQISALGDWDGQGPLDLKVPLKGDWETAVVLQKKGMGPILASAVVK